ncbi:hypothetical protein [Microbulbifer sp. HZ11]|uniref:hypothetical protein n=1 Tax=Microbulbifer sp. HZ11 TaxID=1453501 RepID=UPI0005BB7157|nr:hypothetical protein [Microbulbifer sp. HZ11]
MIEYKYQEEKVVAKFFANLLNDGETLAIIDRGFVSSAEEATHLSKFFWAMVNKSAQGVNLPCEGTSEYWTEKLYSTLGGYLERAGYEQQWNDEIDNA